MSDVKAEHFFYVLHSPYGDKTWRGIEKCAGDPPLLFASQELAEKFANKNNLTEFVAVEITVTTPAVRGSLSLPILPRRQL